MIVLLLFAFIAGLITVLSPCILPVLPLLLAAGIGTGRYRPYGIIIGLMISFTFFTLALTALVHATGISPNILRYISIGLIIFFGLTMIFPQFERLFNRITAPLARLGGTVQAGTTATDTAQSGNGFFSGFILGSALGLIWSPCAGPILATITTLVATGSVTWNAVIVTLAYSFGTAVPMFLIMYGGNKITGSISFLTPYTEIIRKIFGILMILGALAIAFHLDTVLQQFAVRYFPTIKIEDNPHVAQALEQLQLQKGADMKPLSPAPVVGNPAPDFVGIADWINSPALTLQELRGKVVLVDFWTYSCINCVRTLPHLKQWYAQYKDAGFVIVGVHTPEFEFEKSLTNVADAVKRFGITYPVALDSNYATWNAYHNRYWPAHYLIDQQGILRYIHFGEGEYAKTETMIRSLLGLSKSVELAQESQKFHQQTPEIYLGFTRAQNYTPEIRLVHNKNGEYSYKAHLADDTVGLQGEWLVGAESITAGKHAQLTLNFTAQNVYLVISAQKPSSISVTIDGKPNPAITVQESRMYEIVDLKKNSGRHLLNLQVPEGVSFYAFTFNG